MSTVDIHWSLGGAESARELEVIDEASSPRSGGAAGVRQCRGVGGHLAIRVSSRAIQKGGPQRPIMEALRASEGRGLI